MIRSVSAYIAYRIGTYTCMPYVYNSSQDVEKCALDLVSSSSTHTNTVQAIAVASKGACFFLFEPLTTALRTTRSTAHTTGEMLVARASRLAAPDPAALELEREPPAGTRERRPSCGAVPF